MDPKPKADVGLLDDFKPHPDVLRQVDEFKDMVLDNCRDVRGMKLHDLNRAEDISDHLKGLSTYVGRGDLSSPLPPLYSVGQSNFYSSYSGTVTLERIAGQTYFSYDIQMHFYLRDWFTKPIPGLDCELPFGTKYQINADWNERIKGISK